MDIIRQAVAEKLRVHPRVVQQGMGNDPEQCRRLAASLPVIVPFQGRTIERAIALLDWDHRLPSRNLVLHVHTFYSVDGVAEFEKAYGARTVEIDWKNLYPEFDVPDYEDLPSDEGYAAVLKTEGLAVESVRLISPWRRLIPPKVSEQVVAAVRVSPEFAQISDLAERPSFLGDLEAVAWTPPCESGHTKWTVDVWWVTSFDGRMGRGYSFLVDSEAPEGKQVILRRDFSVRTG